MTDQPPIPKEERRPRDAGHWARYVETLEGSGGLNVEGRRPMSPLQGFGSMWQKTFRIHLTGTDATPAEVVEVWRKRFPEMTGFGSGFRVPAGGLVPGAVALLGGISGVMVLYADDESFTYMTPEGHPFSGWITFSSFEEDDATAVQAQVLMRANDPLYEMGLRMGGHKMEDEMWRQTLANLAAHFGVHERVETHIICVDPKLQWKEYRNVWHNAGIRSALYSVTAPLRWRRSRGSR